jgi:tRNA pseudouridine38-40 synthase
LEYQRAWHVPAALDFVAIRREAEAFVGTHNFASFAANRGKPEDNTVRTIDGVRIRRRGKCIELEFSGNGFLYKMVRLMAGALVRCGRGQESTGAIARRLTNPAATSSSARLVAPAEGLILLRVRY